MIRYNEKPNKIRFIESLDTVRHVPTKDNNERDKRELHSNIEVMLSLLFGEQIVVSEPQSFDSLGFLNIASSIIDSRPPKSKSNDSPVYDPFILALRPGHESYTEMIASLLRKDNFKLSGWPDITNKMSEREELASMVGESNFDGVKDFGKTKGRQLESLNKYFIEEKRFKLVSTKNPDIPLIKYIEYLSKIDVDKLPLYHMRLEDYKNHKERVLELRSASKILKDNQIDLSNRSSLHQLGKDILENDILEGLLEFSNSCYNCVVANSVMANTSVFSTSGKGENDYVLSANSLADHAMYSMSKKDKLTGRSYLSISPDADLVKQFEKNEIDWEEIWKNILINKDFIKSVNKLNENILRNDQVKARNTLSDHITFLSKNLPFDIKESEKGWINIIGAGIGFGIGGIIGSLIGGPIGGGMGAIGGEVLGSYCPKRINNWWIEGTIWTNLYRSVEIERIDKNV